LLTDGVELERFSAALVKKCQSADVIVDDLGAFDNAV
jgi:hypothetical protein